MIDVRKLVHLAVTREGGEDHHFERSHAFWNYAQEAGAEHVGAIVLRLLDGLSAKNVLTLARSLSRDEALQTPAPGAFDDGVDQTSQDGNLIAAALAPGDDVTVMSVIERLVAALPTAERLRMIVDLTGRDVGYGADDGPHVLPTDGCYTDPE